MNRLIGRAGSQMADVFTKKKRSEIMSHIRSRETAPELLFKRFLDQVGASYVYQPSIFGKPDFLLKGDIAVFIDNRFWHGKSKLPKQNRKYWLAKLERNRKRDVEVNRQLRKDGYQVVRIEDKVVLKMLKDLNVKGGR